MREWLDRTHVGDCRVLLARMVRDGVRVQACVTSPPYYHLRDYGAEGQIGLEETPVEYICELVKVFAAVRKVLRDDGTVWLNLGDSYANDLKWGGSTSGKHAGALHGRSGIGRRRRTTGAKGKDLLGIPWRVALALQADGWYLRSNVVEEVELFCPCGCGVVLEERIWRWDPDREVIWNKPNAMPESVRDRPTKSHEHIFLMSKSPRYYYDADAIKEPARCGLPGPTGSRRHVYGEGPRARLRTVGMGANARASKAVPNIGFSRKALRSQTESRHRSAIPGGQSMQAAPNGWRNKRSVWTVATTPFPGAHYAVFPRKLIEPCILASTRPGDIVLDPFAGAGTTRRASADLGRRYVGCEIQPRYVALDEGLCDTGGSRR
jgi:hypothetical protein